MRVVDPEFLNFEVFKEPRILFLSLPEVTSLASANLLVNYVSYLTVFLSVQVLLNNYSMKYTEPIQSQ